MAIVTVSDSGGNWSDTAAWVGGSVPLAADNVVFTSTSGQLTLADQRVCTGINFSNYVNTMTFNQNLIVNGPINLGTGGYTLSGTFGIVASQSVTLTSNGQTWSLPMTFVGTSQTFTFSDSFSVNNDVTLNGTTLTRLNNNRLRIGKNLSIGSGNVVLGTTELVMNGTGTWSQVDATSELRNPITFDTTGTVNLSGLLRYQIGRIKYTSGNVISNANNILLCLTSTTFSTAGMTWSNVILTSTASIGFTYSLENDLVVNNLTLTASRNSPVATNIIRVRGSNRAKITGNLLIDGTQQMNLTGNATFSFIGSGSFSRVTPGPAPSWYYTNINNPVEIETDGLLQIGGADTGPEISTVPRNSFGFYSTTFSYIKGNVDDRSMFFQECFIKPTGLTDSIYFRNVSLYAVTTLLGDMYVSGTAALYNSTYTFGTYSIYFKDRFGNLVGNAYFRNDTGSLSAADFPVGSYITVSNVSTAGTQDVFINRAVIDVKGSFTNGRTTFGTSKFRLVGSGTFSFFNPQYIRSNIDIQPVDLSIRGDIYYAGGTMTYYGGTVSTTGSRLILCNPLVTGATQTSISSTTGSTPIYWNNVSITNASSGVNLSLFLLSDFYVNGTCSLTNTLNGSGFISVTTSNGSLLKFSDSTGQMVGSLQAHSHNTSTIRLPGDINVGNLILGSASTALATLIDNYSISIHRDLIIRGAGNSRGSSNLFLVGTGSWYNEANSIGSLSSNLNINTPGTITVTGLVRYGAALIGQLSYTSGLVTTTGSTILFGGPNSINTNGIVWNEIQTQSTTNISSLLYSSGTFSITTGNVGFTGSAGFSAGILLLNTANLTHTFKSGLEYIVRDKFIATQSTATTPITLTASTSGSSSYITVNSGATVDVAYVNATDINSSLGQTVYAYKANLLRTTNWNLLPTDIPTVSAIFIN